MIFARWSGFGAQQETKISQISSLMFKSRRGGCFFSIVTMYITRASDYPINGTSPLTTSLLEQSVRRDNVIEMGAYWCRLLASLTGIRAKISRCSVPYHTLTHRPPGFSGDRHFDLATQEPNSGGPTLRDISTDASRREALLYKPLQLQSAIASGVC